MFRRVNDICKRQRTCPHCGAHNGVVKKAGGALKIVHEAYAKNAAAAAALRSSMRAAAGYNDALGAHLGRVADDLHPLRAQALLAAIPEDALVRGLGGWWWWGGV